MVKKIRISKLRLKGLNKDYDYGFLPGLNIIAGPISTGKTSILEFIDYCLGAQSHPEHIEIQNKATRIQLEIELNNEPIVIERPLFSSDSKITIHECSLSDLDTEHPIKTTQSRHRHDKESISSYILDRLDLADIKLKEAPTKEGSDYDTLSLRNLMWYSFLKNERLDSKDLLFESSFVKNIKLKQVFDIIFKVHANEKATLSFQIKDLETQINRFKTEIDTLTSFLDEQKVPSFDELMALSATLSNQEKDLKRQLNILTSTLKGESDTAQNIRSSISSEEEKLKRLLVSKRDRDTLLKRLLPLRGQYSEEIKKLHFLAEAKAIFNPLAIVRCPYCLEVISEVSDEHHCSLCRKPISIEPEESFNVDKEIRNVKTKLKELNSFIQEVSTELEDIESQLRLEEKSIKILQKRLDEAMKDYISPYISERDAIVGELNRVRQEQVDLDNQLNLHEGLQKRIQMRLKLEEELGDKKIDLHEEDSKKERKEEVIGEVSGRFKEILTDIGFPKLNNADIGEDLVPTIRGKDYKMIGGSGAQTLVSIGWFLSIFEQAIEMGGHHLGFIMIDGVQKNIGIGAREDEIEYRDVKIVDGLYRHVIQKTLEYGSDAQIILVDNEPPIFANCYISIKFSRRKEFPPYGLIDDETD